MNRQVIEHIGLDESAKLASQLTRQTREVLSRNLVDMDAVISQVMIALVANGHCLLEGVPGTAKTTLCRDFAAVLGLQYSRIQFTPDVLPSDVTGTKVFDNKEAEFVLKTGPVFCQLLLADELNRSPARTQSALLEAMQERQVTIEGETLPLPSPYIVLATQNPVEQEGVYRLPEAQLDRFLIRVGYPSRQSEIDLLDLQQTPAAAIESLWKPEQIIQLQQHVNLVFGIPELKEYVVDLARASRDHPDILLGASPRAAIFLQRAAKARALLTGRTFFTHDDVQAIAYSVLSHRLIMKPESELSGVQIENVIHDIVRSVPIRGEPGPSQQQP